MDEGCGPLFLIALVVVVAIACVVAVLLLVALVVFVLLGGIGALTIGAGAIAIGRRCDAERQMSEAEPEEDW